ncbi:MAG: DUF4290 domain-containing protein [Bacteroidales bacterium]|nr:DUF4290 domain-containing protein [Bacteroidales bacterium]
MKKYNTQLPQVALPEYGRHVQNLVEYCKTIPDRQRRTEFAKTVIGIMADVYPEIGQGLEATQTLWDHLALIANYELDIDYPFEINQKDKNFRPAQLPPPQGRIINRIYGYTTEQLVALALEKQDPNERIALFEQCANNMKRNFHVAHPAAEENNDKIIDDLITYTGPDFAEEVKNVQLLSAQELLNNTQYDASKLDATRTKKKKKKKKKTA